MRVAVNNVSSLMLFKSPLQVIGNTGVVRAISA